MNILSSVDLGAVFNGIPNPIFIKNENLQFIFINKAYERMFNVKLEDVVGKTVLDLEYFPEEERIFYQKEDAEMIKHGKMKHHVFDYLYKGKEMHTCHYWTSGFIQKNGVRGLIGVIVDINNQSRIIYSLRDQLRVLGIEKKEIEKKHKLDPLTNLYTRGVLDESLQWLVSSNNNFSCIMLDIDHFKTVNDTFGHSAGDSVLQEFASALKRCARKRDLIYRYGGEEFVILLPESKLDEAMKMAERIRLNVARNMRLPDGGGVTGSAGCSEYIVGEPAALVMQRADKALYMAKESGRNKVCQA